MYWIIQQTVTKVKYLSLQTLLYLMKMVGKDVSTEEAAHHADVRLKDGHDDIRVETHVPDDETHRPLELRQVTQHH